MLVVGGDVMLVVGGDVMLVVGLLWQQSHGFSVDSTSMICLLLPPRSYGTVGVLHSRQASPVLIPEMITPQGMHCTSPS